MQEEKFGKLIREIRKKNHLTQKDLADKYHVTYQAVSKWENGKNLPDITLMKQISDDFNVSIDNLMEGNLEEKKKNKTLLVVIIIISLLLLIGLIILVRKGNDDFDTKTISSMCKDYKISGVIAYNKSKSSIYIPKIEYCGEEKKILYKEINCTLFEKNGDVTKQISSYYYDDKPITIEDFMKNVSFNVDNYLKLCQEFNKNSFYLEIKALDDNDEIYYHTIPLVLDDKCEE